MTLGYSWPSVSNSQDRFELLLCEQLAFFGFSLWAYSQVYERESNAWLWRKTTPLNLPSADISNLVFSAILLLCKPRWQLHLAANLILLYNFINFDPFGNTRVPKTASCQTLGIAFLVLKNDCAKKLSSKVAQKVFPLPLQSTILSQPIFFVNLIISSTHPCKFLRSKAEEN